MSESAQLRAYERQFRRAGLPLFVEGFSASTDVFNRAALVLSIVFIGELLGAGQLDWTWWQNLLAILGGVAFMLVAIAVLNVAAGHTLSAIPSASASPSSRPSCSCRRSCRSSSAARSAASPARSPPIRRCLR